MVDFSGLDQFSTMLDAPADKAGVREIPIDLIEPDPEQPRKTFDQAKLLELSESIEVHGVIQPVVLRTVGDRFQLIAGERRWRASGLAKLATIPAIVRDDLTARAQMVENLQREDLSAFEIYRVIAAEIDGGASQKELGKHYGKSKQWISDYAAVAKMPPALQDALRDGRASDISALVTLSRLHKQSPEKVEQLAESGAPITRHLVNQLADSLARKATGVGAPTSGADTGKTPPKANTEPKTSGEQNAGGNESEDRDDTGTRPSGVADNGEGLDLGGRGPAAIPGTDGGAPNADTYKAPQAVSQDLPVGIKVQYEGDTYWLRYDQQKDEAGRRLVMIATDAGLTLYAPMSDLVLEAIYSPNTGSGA